MDVLIIGNGGREHALAWKLRQSPKLSQLYVASGNAGTNELAKNLTLTTKEAILGWLSTNRMDLVVVGPDNYLAEGIVDQIEAMGIPVFGPARAAAEIEWSKAFAKQFMKRHAIPTASYEVFTDLEPAVIYIETQAYPLVIKASGLALGKGVIIAKSIIEARTALQDMLQDKVFGEAGNEVVIEEYLEGKEISIHAFCDGEDAVLFPAAQDHKRTFDNDEGPNTGGMGTIAPVPWVTTEILNEIKKQVVIPTLEALKQEGRLFKGILFPGIMLTTQGPKVIEFNARFGDPETQSYMRLLETDLLEVLLACVNGTLVETEIVWSERSACCIVAASGGYPGTYEKGKPISGLDTVIEYEVLIFHAGTKMEGEEVVTDGGRVLNVSMVADDLQEALATAYRAIDHINFEGMQYRSDIGAKSL